MSSPNDDRKRFRLPPSVSLVLRLGVSGALVAYLLTTLDTETMARFLRRAHLPLVALTLVTVMMDRALMVFRWSSLLDALGFTAPRIRVIKIFFLSTFFGSFLPSGVGGEAVRAVSLSRLTRKGVESVASVAMDRFLGLISMLLTGLIALIVFYRAYPHVGLVAAFFSLLTVVCMGIFVLLFPRWNRWLSELLTKMLPGPGPWIGRLIEALGEYRQRGSTLWWVLALSVSVQLLRVAQAYLLSEAMGLGVAFQYFLLFVPIILMVTMLPISLGGLGTTNAAYVYLFEPVGMDPAGAFVLSVLILALGVFGNLPGGLIYAWEGLAATEGSDMARHDDPGG